jgi:hypothetical protein
MSRVVIGPEVIDDRISYMDNKSIWYFIELINYGLSVNKVEPDGRINVLLKYNISSDLVDQIVNLYLSKGWADINVTFTGTSDSLYGTTEFEFIPPVVLIKRAQRRIRKKM